MKTYVVTIRATVTKRISVKAATKEQAAEAANQQFDVRLGGSDEHYTQETLNVEAE